MHFGVFFVNKKNSRRGTMKNGSIPGEYERFSRDGSAFVAGSIFCMI